MALSQRAKYLLLSALGDPALRDEVSNAIDAAETIQASEIATGAVTTDKIADLGVTTGKINDLGVTTGKLAANAVTTAKLGAAAVTATELASDAVTTIKILNANVTTAKLASGAVTTTELGNNAVTSAKLATNLLQFTDVTVTTAQVLALNTTPKELVAAPGAGFVNIVDSVYSTIDYNSAAYVVDAAGFTVRYTNGAGASVGATLTQAFGQASADAKQSVIAAATALTPVTNAAIVLYADNTNPTTGNSDIKVRVYYRVVPELL